MDPFAQESGLAEAGGGGDEGQLARHPRVQPLDQARARDQFWAGGGDIELGRQEGTNFRLLPSVILNPRPRSVSSERSVQETTLRHIGRPRDGHLGHRLSRHIVTIRTVVPLPGVVVAPPFAVVGDEIDKSRLC